MRGKIVKGVGGQYTVRAGQNNYICKIRGALHREDRVCVGDDVDFDENALVIGRILPRKNFLLRPSVSNVDQVLFLIAPSPKPDFLLLDKILVRCLAERVPIFLCLNKQDIAEADFEREVRFQYGGAADGFFVFSAKTGEGIEGVRRALAGKFSCLSGQSAVGKSSLLNALFPELSAEVGGLSKKTERGRHTTRHSEIFSVGDILLCDTPGFSSFELTGIPADRLCEYYPDYFEASAACRYRGCTHLKEPDCEVKRRVQAGVCSAARYERYAGLCEELKKRRSYE